ncbi:MAG: ferritin family protein [Candidatus Thermoplasmatota archaeon]|nr:Rubrerythrin [Euryarchaeota archaeon]MBU4033060.1 ferritin family protein [Candidatus Thermoplasmatota archaeon]MBU4072102.1 ferritin family protein [Candidatus Thermoplasmatota archaeon]MBU4143685.1 ferritin family protein [Candidatus Thermoplasmatota archaeon]MBU4591801.1 ferritin family protein [Candidatus Thermoplasmatota archaeon]
MDLEGLSLEELFYTAIKAEMDSKEAYSIMAGITRNAFLKDRFRFLAGEEEKHRSFLTQQYEVQFPSKALELPAVSHVPLPEIDVKNGHLSISDLLQQAMNAERAACDFYQSFAKFVKSDKALATTLGYFARMEESHYQMLKQELEAEEEFETFDNFNPGMHLGP